MVPGAMKEKATAARPVRLLRKALPRARLPAPALARARVVRLPAHPHNTSAPPCTGLRGDVFPRGTFRRNQAAGMSRPLF